LSFEIPIPLRISNALPWEVWIFSGTKHPEEGLKPEMVTKPATI